MSFHNIPVSGNTPLPRFGHTLTYYATNKVVLFGGATGSANQFSMTGSTYSLDIGTRVWSKVASKLQNYASNRNYSVSSSCTCRRKPPS